MKRYVYVSTSFEGLHRYKEAPEEVSYLRDFHRHIFKVVLQIEVEHNERDIEFIMLKHELEKCIASSKHTLQGFDDSCETIAENIIQFIQKKYGMNRDLVCIVSEDGENGAILEYIVE